MTNADNTTEAILKYYKDEVVPALAAATITADKMPVEVLNEIRNSVTHLAAASTAETAALKTKEIDAARRHMKRACIDSLKTSVYYSSKKSDEHISAMSGDMQLPNNVYLETSALRRKRLLLSESEGRRDLDDAITAYASLANEYDAFYQKLTTDYGGEMAAIRKAHRDKKAKKERSLDWLGGAVVGIVLSKVVEYLF